jgi:hypothetical protein
VGISSASGDPSGGNGSNQPTALPTGTVASFRGGAFFIAEASYLPNQGFFHAPTVCNGLS